MLYKQTRKHATVQYYTTLGLRVLLPFHHHLRKFYDLRRLQGLGVPVPAARVRYLVGVGVTPRSPLNPPDGACTDSRQASVWNGSLCNSSVADGTLHFPQQFGHLGRDEAG